MSSDLNDYVDKCRCCLENTKGDTYLKITNIIEERFEEFTSSQLISCDKLSRQICMTCNSLLARYSVLKRTFLENQKMLLKLLGKQNRSFNFVKIEEQEDTSIINDDHEQRTDFETTKEADKIDLVEIETSRDIPTSKLKHNNNKRTSNKNSPKTQSTKQTTKPKCKKKIRRLMCEKCSKEFNQIGSFNRHLIVHSSGIVKKFSCDYCGFASHWKSDLGVHLKTHLPKKYRIAFYCDIKECNKFYYNKKTLERHMQSVHLKLPNFKCPLCDKTFSLKFIMSRHMNHVHRNIRPAICDIDKCDAAFPDNNKLKRHKRQVHKIFK
ncbi:CLUMA_CG009890, isoform A [Clunio marinus]|uniref:CLUMA_CG009890, isoform A n=1 Tax=Clunio marinus TaxID=568069 RepID=A0A1J1I8Z2_9DIPT|nr:CLUMA_CG009890, isoform A [Clunio marinus]